MNTWTFLDLVVTAIRGNAALVNYSVQEYGREPRVFDAYAGDFPPAPAECPYILVHSPGKSANQERRTIEYGITVDFFVYDEDDVARADDVESSTGTERLLRLQSLARTAILAAMPAGTVTGYEDAANTAEMWPLLPGTSLYDFSQPLVIGQDPMA